MVFTIADLLRGWESAGIFDFLLPFLLIFAVVFGILSTIGIFGKNKGVNVVIAVTIGLLALRLDFVPRFFTEIFPRLGVGLAVILVALILMGLFVAADERRYWLWGLGTISVIAFFIIITRSFDVLGWLYTYAGGDLAGWIIGAILVIGLIVAVSAAGAEKQPGRKEQAVLGPWHGSQHGE